MALCVLCTKSMEVKKNGTGAMTTAKNKVCIGLKIVI